MLEAFGKMFESIGTTDVYILIAAIIELALFIFALSLAKNSAVNFEINKKDTDVSNKKKKVSNSVLVTVYNLFVTGISIFPLLGMLGTVSGLLGLDLAAGDMSNIKNNFFMALTSTAWGIVFSIIFKVLHAWKEFYFEKKIKESTELMEECNKIFEKENG